MFVWRIGQELVPAAGVEPATFRSGGERSNPLSYAGMGLFKNNIAMRGGASGGCSAKCWFARRKLTACATLTMLDDHTFDNICYLLTAIDGFFKFLVNVFPLNNLERVTSLMKQCAHSSLINVIAFIFEAVQLDQALSHASGFL